MDVTDLTSLLVAERESEPELPAAVQALRARFPLNEMVPHVQRVLGTKPSERVRLREAQRLLRAEGFRVDSPDDFTTRHPQLRVSCHFNQHGDLYHLTVTAPQEPPDLAALARAQELLLERGLPLLCTGERLEMIYGECEPQELVWRELGLDIGWAELQQESGLPLERLLEWAALFDEHGTPWNELAWLQSDVTPEQAQPWLAAGIDDFDDMQQWLALKAPGLTPQLAGELQERGIDADDASVTRRLWQR